MDAQTRYYNTYTCGCVVAAALNFREWMDGRTKVVYMCVVANIARMNTGYNYRNEFENAKLLYERKVDITSVALIY